MVPPRRDLIVAHEVFIRSKQIAIYIFNKEKSIRQRHDKVGEKVYELCDEMRRNYDDFFTGMVHRLEISEENIDRVTQMVMRELLNEGCNFGRIVSLYSFCLTLCIFFPQQVEVITTNTSQVLFEHLQWFESHGSWNGLADYFRTPEEKLWKGMVITTLGLGAVASLLYIRS